MSRGLWMVVKWLVFPAACAALGYYVVGPRYGKRLPVIGSESGSAPFSSNSTPSDQTPAATSYPAPDVDVSVGSHANPSATRRHRRRRSKPKPPVETPSPTPATPPDAGGSGGAATGGGVNGPG